MMLWLAACASSPRPPAPAPAPAEPAAPAAPAPVPDVPVELGPELVGMCDASGAVQIGRFVVVADDERNTLMVYDWSAKAAPAPSIDLASLSPLFAGKDEADLEGMAKMPDGTVWVIASHDAGKKDTERKPARQRLFALALAEGEGRVDATLKGNVSVDLIEKGQYTKPMYGIISNTIGKTSKDPLGLSIEGLAAGPSGSLLVGFRNPVHSNKALVQRLESPEAFVAGGEADFTGPRWLPLGGSGVRSLESDGEGAFVLVSGPSGDEDGFSIWRWRGFDDGTPPERQPIDLGDLHPEALLQIDGAWWVLSDDGNRKIDGEKCKDLPREKQRTRTARISL